MTALRKALRPAALRLRAQRAISWGSLGMASGALLAFLYAAASFLWPLAEALRLGLLAVLSGAAMSGLLGWLWRLSPATAARRVDACGLKARAQTALELSSMPDTPMSVIQRADTLRALQAFPLKEIPLRPHRLSLWVTLSCAALWGVLLLLPNPQSVTLKARAEFKQEMQKQAEHLEAGAKALAQGEEEAALEARQLLEQLSSELRNAGEPRDALEAVDQTARKLESLRQNEAQSLRQALSDNGLEALAEAMEQGREGDLRDLLGQSDAASVANALQEASRTAGSASPSLQSAASALQSGNLSQAAQSLAGASQSASSYASKASALLGMAQLSAAQAGQSLGMASSATMPQALSALGAQGRNNGNGLGMGSGGQGAGSGAGQGSTNQDAGYFNDTGRSGGGSGLPPQEKIGEYEVIYDPTRLGGDGELAQEKGFIGEGDSTEATLRGGAGDLGSTVPYGEFAAEYRQSAVRSVQNANLPVYVQKWVENYFQSLLD